MAKDSIINNHKFNNNQIAFLKQKTEKYYNDLNKNIKNILTDKKIFNQSKPDYRGFMEIYNRFFLIKDDLFNSVIEFLNFVEEFIKWIAQFPKYFERYHNFCDCTVYESLWQIEKDKKWIKENQIWSQVKREYSANVFYHLGSMYITFDSYFENHWKVIYYNLMKV